MALFKFPDTVVVHIHVHDSTGNSDIAESLKSLHQKIDKMSPELEKLTAEVAESKTVMLSAKTLIVGLKAKLDAAIDNPAALAALSAELDTNVNDLAAAVTANTPAENEPTPGEGGTGTSGTGTTGETL